MAPQSTFGRVATGLVAAGVGAALAMGHGSFVKPLFNVQTQLNGMWTNAKDNASTRGSAGTQSTTLYFMDDPLNHTGVRQAIGWRTIVQDEEVSTAETIELGWVRYAANGTDPDESPTGIIKKVSAPVFGWPLSGPFAFDLTFSIGGGPVNLPVTNGMYIKLPAAPSWPNDGASVHAQLNLPNDPLRPRVTAPFNNKVWTFERPGLALTATPLGGRTLDTLEASTVFWLDPVLETYVVTSAYGNGPEMLFGPESIHPVASRGDQLGFQMEGGNDGQNGIAFFLVSPTLSNMPFKFLPASDSNEVYLDFTAPFPIILQTGMPNPTHGRLVMPPIPFDMFPPVVRSFWAQALLVYPGTWLMRVTDAVGVQGL